MNKITVLILSTILLIVTKTEGQLKITAPELSIQKTILSNAINLQDATTAIQACHNIIAIQGNKSTYKDSLAILYYNSGKFTQSIILGELLLQNKPTDLTLLSILADSYKKIGVVKDGIIYQEKLFKLKPSLVYGFILMEMQLELQRYFELINTSKVVLSNKIDNDLVYSYKDSANQNLKTPLKAAILNMIGTAYYMQNNKKEAANLYKQALLIDEKYLVAKTNLEAVSKEGF